MHSKTYCRYNHRLSLDKFTSIVMFFFLASLESRIFILWNSKDALPSKPNPYNPISHSVFYVLLNIQDSGSSCVPWYCKNLHILIIIVKQPFTSIIEYRPPLIFSSTELLIHSFRRNPLMSSLRLSPSTSFVSLNPPMYNFMRSF